MKSRMLSSRKWDGADGLIVMFIPLLEKNKYKLCLQIMFTNYVYEVIPKMHKTDEKNIKSELKL